MARNLWIFAFGGNEVSPVGLTDPKTGKAVVPDIPMQWRRTVDTCRLVADIIRKHPDDLYLMTHGNGPQVGNILLRAEYSLPILPPLPLDVCGADSQGAMGYMLAQLGNELKMRGINKPVAALITQVVVDRDDPDFRNPSKYVGPSYTAREAKERRERQGWIMKFYKKDDKGAEVWRRVVPSPVPRDIVEIEAVEAMLKAGIIPIAAGGGGIPVAEITPRAEGAEEIYDCNYGIRFSKKAGKKPARIYSGVEAVIDKDLASALLGNMLYKRAGARGEELEISLTIFTAEDGAKLNYQKPDQTDLRRLTAAQALEIYNRTPPPFPAGSMGPKIMAAIKFIQNGGSAAYISRTDKFEETLKGRAGTTVTK